MAVTSSRSPAFPLWRGLLPALTAGLLTAELIATLWVRDAALAAAPAWRELAAAGYLLPPSGPVLAGLEDWRSAAAAGLLIALSLGLLLTLCGWGLAAAAGHLGRRPARTLLAAAVLAAAALVNLDGFLPWPTLLLVVPLAAYLSAERWPPGSVLAPLLLIAGLVAGLLAAGLDLTSLYAVRDRLLLSNPAGQALARVYYRHGLLAALPLQNPDQALIRPFRLTGEHPRREEILAALAASGYFPVQAPTSMRIALEDERQVLQDGERPAARLALRDLLVRPGAALQSVAAPTRPPLPRRLAQAGLLFAPPLVLALLLYAAVEAMAIRRCPSRWAAAAASAVVLVAAAMLGLALRPAPPSDLPGALAAGAALGDQATGLRQVFRDGRAAAFRSEVLALTGSPAPVVRYWAAWALGGERSAPGRKALLGLMHDPEPTVAAAAYAALARRRERAAIPALEAVLRQGDDWHLQRKAYLALRELGWSPAGRRSGFEPEGPR